MFTKTKFAFAAALILGTASAALAGSDRETNPSEAQSAREWAEFLGQNQKHMGNLNAAKAYGFVTSTRQADHSQSRKRGHNKGAVRPFTQSERNWFNYQDQE